jgi:hypothetical protein
MQFDAIARDAPSEQQRDEKRLTTAKDSPPPNSVFSPQVCPAEGAPGIDSDSSPPACTRTLAKQLRPSPLPSGF